MASNSFGTIFRITTFGESHGKAIGVVIDGCPAGLKISLNEIQAALDLRAPGRNPYTSPRKEKDQADILSGVFEGKTTGAPICIIIPNKDADSSKYEPIKDILRPGHANFTYTKKYGCFDYRGGGRSSARETACRVAAGAVARKFLESQGVSFYAYLKELGSVCMESNLEYAENIRGNIYESDVFCPDKASSAKMQSHLLALKESGESTGGLVELQVHSLPVGLGDPVYEKLEAKLASAMMSLPASKGFEIGSGFDATSMSGSEHNDCFYSDGDLVRTHSNYAGGTLGGISTGMPLSCRVAFKPTSSITNEQITCDYSGNEVRFNLPKGSRHDPCVAIRAVPVVEAMGALVLADTLLMNRCARL
ncbi:MAG: chorismate synthase [Waddliaceae bacterium]|nr:chorismate synthase [Waddliaceae bacterium]